MLHSLEHVRDHQNPLAGTPTLVSCQAPQLGRPRFAAEKVCRHPPSPKHSTLAYQLYHIWGSPEAGIIRPDPAEAERICQLYNQYLRNDGFQIVEKTRLSGKPVFVGLYVGVGITPAISTAKETLGGTDPGYVAQQITRMEAAVANDPALAIGTAKELVETCCKTILQARRIQFGKSADLPELVKL